MPTEATAVRAVPETGSSVLIRPRFRLYEALPWVAAAVVYLFLPGYLSLGTQMMVMILFALSLDVLIGYAGIVTLGHALFFGVGAYGAGLLALNGWTEPISGLLIAAVGCALLGAVLSFGLSRLRGLLLIMMTLALGLVAHEVGKHLKWLTGGDDGMPGIEVDPVFGAFHWSVYGHTAFLYALGILFVMFIVLRTVLASPFGLALRGLRENYGRMQLVGAPVQRHLLQAFALSGFYAGAAGALSAQTTGFVDLSVLSLDMSAGVLVMLVLGGLGRLYGAFVGVIVYMLVQNVAAKVDPYYWMFVVGALLVVVVLFSRGGILGMIEALSKRMRG